MATKELSSESSRMSTGSRTTASLGDSFFLPSNFYFRTFLFESLFLNRSVRYVLPPSFLMIVCLQFLHINCFVRMLELRYISIFRFSKQFTFYFRTSKVCFYMSKHCTHNVKIGQSCKVNAVPVTVPAAKNKVRKTFNDNLTTYFKMFFKWTVLFCLRVSSASSGF